MRSLWIAALLLASATAVPAYAQDHDHGQQQGDGKNDGGPRGGGQGGQHQGGGGGRPAGAPAAVQAPRFQPQQQQGRPNGGDFAGRDRGPGGAPGGMRPAQPFNGGDRGQAAPDRRAGGDPRRFAGRPEGGVQVWEGQPGQPGGRDDRGRAVANGGPAPRDWNGGRPNGGQGWNGGRPGNGQYRNGDRPDRGGDRYADGGDWNRGWRQDRRYNWQGWRSQHREIYRLGRYRPPYGAGWGYRNYGVGYRIDPIFFAQDYWIANPDYYRLPPAYGEYRWVRYYNDALLIDLEDGEVVDAIPSFFY